jgi:hypothetical protein
VRNLGEESAFGRGWTWWGDCCGGGAFHAVIR